MTLDAEYDQIIAAGTAALKATEPPRVHVPVLIPNTKESS